MIKKIDYRTIDGVSSEPGVVFIDINDISAVRCFERISKPGFFRDRFQWSIVIYMKNGLKHQVDVDSEEIGLDFIKTYLEQE